VANYAASHPEFPHETTADQWFSESQLESYRALGLHTIEKICGGAATPTMAAFFTNVKAAMKPASAVTAPARGDTQGFGVAVEELEIRSGSETVTLSGKDGE
jgi:hypothetical protein